MTIPRTAVIFMDRGRMRRNPAEVAAVAREIADRHGLRVVGVVLAPAQRPDVLESVLERVARTDVTAIVTPGLDHVRREMARIRRACDVVVMSPLAFYKRTPPVQRVRPYVAAGVMA